MPINLKTASVETREQRLGTIIGWDGTASALAGESEFSRGDCSGCGKGRGKARRVCELQGPFTQGSVCSEQMVECQAGHIRDAVLIQHSPIGCGAGQVVYNQRYRNGLAARHLPVENIRFLSTNLRERDMVYGGADKLDHAIRAAFERHKPKAIFIATSCASGIIGDDVESVARACEADLGVPVIPLHCEGFKSKHWSTGFDATQHGILRQIVRRDPTRKQDDLVNVINLWGSDVFTPMLAELGLRVNYVVDLATVKGLAQMSEAAATVSFCYTLGSYLATALEQEFGVPQIMAPQPYGFPGTDAWLRELGRVTGREDKAEAFIAREHARVRPQVEALKPKLKGLKGYVATGSAYSHGLIGVLREIGVEVDGSLVFHHDPVYDSEDPRQDSLSHLIEHYGDVEHFTVGNRQQYQFYNLLQRVKPDFIIIRHNGLAPLAARLGIPAIPLGDEHHARGLPGHDQSRRVDPRRAAAPQVPPGHLQARHPALQGLVAGRARPVRARPRDDGLREDTMALVALKQRSAEAPAPRNDFYPIEKVRYVCAIGAMQSAAAISRVVPITHCGPGCADKQCMNLAFWNGYQSTGYGGGPVSPSTNASQREVIFGGADRLRELIESSLKVLDADLFVVLTGCIPDLVGDDVGSVVRDFQKRGVPIVFAETGGFRGNNFTGHEAVAQAIIEQHVGPFTGRRRKRLVNLWSLLPYHNTFWRGDLEEIKRLLEGIGLEVNVLFGPDSAGIKEWQNIPRAAFNLVLSPWLGVETAKLLEAALRPALPAHSGGADRRPAERRLPARGVGVFRPAARAGGAVHRRRGGTLLSLHRRLHRLLFRILVGPAGEIRGDRRCRLQSRAHQVPGHPARPDSGQPDRHRGPAGGVPRGHPRPVPRHRPRRVGGDRIHRGQLHHPRQDSRCQFRPEAADHLRHHLGARSRQGAEGYAGGGRLPGILRGGAVPQLCRLSRRARLA